MILKVVKAPMYLQMSCCISSLLLGSEHQAGSKIPWEGASAQLIPGWSTAYPNRLMGMFCHLALLPLRNSEPLLETRLVYESYAPRTLARVKKRVLRGSFQATDATNDLVLPRIVMGRRGAKF